ncbi:alpha-tectorin-like isoform X2 [Clavelina lepadiformis]|uniref:alpha-tectorin-like isoform X2 n=1 Tax=Clavelina lepadiformis TaxID=159417 RepID=UPI0040424D19
MHLLFKIVIIFFLLYLYTLEFGDGARNKCKSGKHDCHLNATCINKRRGQYQCICNAGHTGNGTHCRRYDECATGEHECHENATCTNTYYSYKCTCNDGYIGDGKICREDCDLPSGINLFDGRKIVDFLDPLFECDSATVEITFRTCRLKEIGIGTILVATPFTHPSALGFAPSVDPDCRPRRKNEKSVFSFTTIQCNSSYTTFTVMAYTNGYASDSVTTVAKQIAMNFECIRPRLLEVSAVSVLKPKQGSITMLEESDTADFDVSMTRYESDAFLKEEKSDTVALPNYVYIGVEILDDIPANFVLQLKGCWATSRPYINDVINYVLIKNGVAVADNGDEVVILRNSVDSMAHFKFKAFAWTNSKPDIFLFCSVYVCDDDNEDCSTIAVPNDETRNCSIGENERNLSCGPIRVLRRPQCSKDNGGCDHYCHDESKFCFCSCYKGYRLALDKATCVKEEHTVSVNDYVSIFTWHQIKQILQIAFVGIVTIALCLSVFVHCWMTSRKNSSDSGMTLSKYKQSDRLAPSCPNE